MPWPQRSATPQAGCAGAPVRPLPESRAPRRDANCRTDPARAKEMHQNRLASDRQIDWSDTPAATQPGLERWLDFATDCDPVRILENFREFSALVAEAKRCVERADCSMAYVFARSAMLLAVARHPGLYASAELEEALDRAGQTAVPLRQPSRPAPARIGHVLHVCSYVSDV